MMRKNIFHSLLAILATATLTTACMFSQEDIFDEPAAQRMNHVKDQLQSQLVAQSTGGNQGWIIQYFVGSLSAEGVNLFGRFDANGKVTLASDHSYLRGGKAGTYTECTSLYEMLAEEGPVLAFNSWNDVLTVFADPVDPSTLANDGTGMQGDYNLVFNGYEGNNILFRGERHGGEVRFIPCDRPWATYISDVAALKKTITNQTLNVYYLVHGTDTMFYTGVHDGFVDHVDRPVDPLAGYTLTNVFTPEGFRLNSPDTLSGARFQEFHLSTSNDCLLSEDEEVKVIPAWDRYINECSSLWKLDPANFTAEQTALFQQMQTEVKKVNANFELDSLTLGRMTETETIGSVSQKVNYPALVLCVHGPAKMGRVPQYRPYVNMNIDKPAFGQLKLSQSSVTRTNDYMETFAATDLKALGQQFAATLYGSYTMQPNDYFRPTSAVLTPADGGQTIRLVLQAIKD